MKYALDDVFREVLTLLCFDCIHFDEEDPCDWCLNKDKIENLLKKVEADIDDELRVKK
jgi:recombinational DNA repair protein RecR